ncbi:MAG TPA: biotin--[acetyl-CoA-carboxylase] ligase [Desulfobacteraceae bacterium]|nr:biotin--[acetyl-CoA-carboxylase] ligase [Desulfobacteraceae bacterium]HPQ29248.1 biotin--[acetyl-CoA-carboxylase] ligase [Desulfobacteraceae bacterium]
MVLNLSGENDSRIEVNLLKDILGKSKFSKYIHIYDCLDSTNTLAKKFAAEGAPEGTVVVAEEQSSGRGRMGRPWISPGYLNLLFSVLLRPKIRVEKVFVLTMVLALASSECVEETGNLCVMIKWPNDLFVSERKLGGMLTEFHIREKVVEYIVLGLGLNINWSPEDLEDSSTKAFKGLMLYPATSIMKETGHSISRTYLLAEILKRFEIYYKKVLDGYLDDFYDKWNRRSMLFGKMVEVMVMDERIYGKAIKIDYDGALIILDEKGNMRRILNGDVSVKF